MGKRGSFGGRLVWEQVSKRIARNDADGADRDSAADAF